MKSKVVISLPKIDFILDQKIELSVSDKRQLYNRIQKEIRALTTAVNESLDNIIVNTTVNDKIIEVPIHVVSKKIRLQLGTKFLDQVELSPIQIKTQFDDYYHRCLVTIYLEKMDWLYKKDIVKLRTANWLKDKQITELGLQQLQQLREIGPPDTSERFIAKHILHNGPINERLRNSSIVMLDWLTYKGFLTLKQEQFQEGVISNYLWSEGTREWLYERKQMIIETGLAEEEKEGFINCSSKDDLVPYLTSESEWIKVIAKRRYDELSKGDWK